MFSRTHARGVFRKCSLPKTPHPRARAVAPCGIEFPTSDVIVSLDGRVVSSVDDLHRALTRVPHGAKIAMLILRSEPSLAFTLEARYGDLTPRLCASMSQVTRLRTHRS